MKGTQHQLRYEFYLMAIYRISISKSRISKPGKRRFLEHLFGANLRLSWRGLVLVNAVLIGIETDFAVPSHVFGVRTVVPMWCTNVSFPKWSNQDSPGIIWTFQMHTVYSSLGEAGNDFSWSFPKSGPVILFRKYSTTAYLLTKHDKAIIWFVGQICWSNSSYWTELFTSMRSDHRNYLETQKNTRSAWFFQKGLKVNHSSELTCYPIFRDRHAMVARDVCPSPMRCLQRFVSWWQSLPGWCFQIFFIFTPIWGKIQFD